MGYAGKLREISRVCENRVSDDAEIDNLVVVINDGNYKERGYGVGAVYLNYLSTWIVEVSTVRLKPILE